MKFVFAIFLTCCLSIANANPISDATSDPTLKQAIHGIATAVHHVDQQMLDRYVHPEIGVYLPYNIGATPYFRHFNQIDIQELSQIETSFWPVTLFVENDIQSFLSNAQLRYVTTVENDCDDFVYVLEGEPLTQGIYVMPDDLLSTHIKVLMALGEEPDALMPKGQSLDEVVTLEANGYRVIIETGADTLAFSITKIKGRWYLWLIDRYTLDCSA